MIGMQQVSIHDSLYSEASRAAKAQSLTLEEFVAQALELKLEQAPETAPFIFTPAMLKELDESAAEIQTGNFVLEADLDAALEKTKREWRERSQA